MRHNDNPPGYPPMRQLIPVPDVDDDEIDAADDILQDYFSAVDFSFEEAILTYYSPPPSPVEEELLPPEHIQIVRVPPVQAMLAEGNAGQLPDQVDHDEDDPVNELIYALDALQEDEGEQVPVHVQLFDDEDEDILDLRMLQIDPQPCHSRDLIAPFKGIDGKALGPIPISPFPSEYASPPHLSPFWTDDAALAYLYSKPGPSRMENNDEVALEHWPMEIAESEPEVPVETQTVPQPDEPLPSTSRGSRGIWSAGLALGVDGSGRMTGFNFDSTRGGITEPAKDPGQGTCKKRNLSSPSSSAASSQNRSKDESYPRKADANDLLTLSRARKQEIDAKISKRESRSTTKKRSCNSKELRDESTEENIDNPIRPTYPGGAGNCVKRFSNIPGVKEWFANQEKEDELEMDPEELEFERQELEYKTWESTRSKCKARRAQVAVDGKEVEGGAGEEPMDLLEGLSEEEEEAEEEEEEEEKEEPLPRRGRGRPRKMN